MSSLRLLSIGLVLGAVAGLCPAAKAADTFTGYARSIDGDSLYVNETEVRLFGIDAPEWSQECMRGGQPWQCGQEAAEQLSKLVTGKKVDCIKVDVDDHGRTVAQCEVGSIDVNRTMVALGYAIAYRRYSTAYVSAEASARVASRGLWSGKFEMPSDYRHEQPYVRKPKRERAARIASSSPSPQPSGNCNIKGNRGSHGWIYHLPGMPYYNQTNAEEMFCTEAEAQAAGYRRAKVR
jgi:endonuclease YncB( thermonuclease family)